MAEHERERDERIERQRGDERPREGAMHQVMPVDREQCADGDRRDGDETAVDAEDVVHAVDHQRHVDDIEANEHEQRGEQRDDDAAIAELRARLDHLRQPHFGPLRAVERHEQRAEHDAERAGERRPARRQAHAGPDETDRDREKVEIAEKPERSLAGELRMALALRNVVDRMMLDLKAGWFGASEVEGLGAMHDDDVSVSMPRQAACLRANERGA
jgi:hypothetical protein